MSVFATEFPVKKAISEATFMAEAIAWIRGIQNSAVLEGFDEKDLHDDDATIRAPNGETLSFKKIEGPDLIVIGVRHEMPDPQGRIWRTECVLTKEGARAFFRVRGQCVAAQPDADVHRPKKPHLIRQAVEEGWGNKDGPFLVQAKAHYLSEPDLDLAKSIVQGEAHCLLPCIYVSRNNDNTLPVDADRLALLLSGLAHVTVEPSRGFSFSLMEIAARNNPYGGAVGIFTFETGELARFQSTNTTSQDAQLQDKIENHTITLVSKRSAQFGWEWQNLQERQAWILRQRLREQASDDLSEYIDLFDAELTAKNETIENLREQLALSEASRSTTHLSSGLLPDELVTSLGQELYDGEFSDRLRLFLSDQVSSPNEETDARTLKLINRVVENSAFSGRAVGLINQIKAGGKDGNQMPKQIGSLLSGLGFGKSSDGKHTKFTPSQDLFGLSIQVLPTTPGDASRGGRNKAQEIIKDFGLSRLK